MPKPSTMLMSSHTNVALSKIMGADHNAGAPRVNRVMRPSRSAGR
jgi:hypothetical protein